MTNNVTEEFEKMTKDLTGSKYAIGVSNATSALQLSLKSLGIGKGDEVIIPDITFVATANAVLFTGATPVLADVNEDDLNISINSIDKNITKKTKAIVPVHFAGSIAFFCQNEIREVAEELNFRVGNFERRPIEGLVSFHTNKKA